MKKNAGTGFKIVGAKMKRTKLQRLQEQLKKDIALSFGKRLKKTLCELNRVHYNISKIKQR